jgi:hypothetical protein
MVTFSASSRQPSFKLKYTTSASATSVDREAAVVLRVLWVVFRPLLPLGDVFEQYPLYLLIGIVL